MDFVPINDIETTLVTSSMNGRNDGSKKTVSMFMCAAVSKLKTLEEL